MSRYVDIECDAVTEGIGRVAFKNRSDIKEFLDDIPTADVVEVVRCKDCDYSVGDGEKSTLLCNHPNGLYLPKPNCYCSYGIKKGKEER